LTRWHEEVVVDKTTIYILMNGISVRNFTRRKMPVSPFVKAAKAVLPDWEISLVFVGETRAKKLNISLRNKTYTPNVLSYVLGKKHGEIFICLITAEKNASSFGLSASNFILFLFIHGLLHLKGYRHGTTMKRHEQKLLARVAGNNVYIYKNESTHSNRN